MNIYLVNRFSKFKGPFDIIDSNRQHIMKVGDICIRDNMDSVDFLVVISVENSWNACKKVGNGSNDVLSGQGNTLLFSFDGLHKRKGNIHFMKILLSCFHEKVIIDFFQNAISILEYKCDYWDVSLFAKFFETSQEIVNRTEVVNHKNAIAVRKYPSVFAKYLNDKQLEILISSINEGLSLKDAYMILREKDAKHFRFSLMKFLEENPTCSIYDKPTDDGIIANINADVVQDNKTIVPEYNPKEVVSYDEDLSYLLSNYNRTEFTKLLELYHKGDNKAFEQLVKSNMTLVAGIARSYKGYGVEYEDLVQEGMFGLMKAIKLFNPKRNVSFHVYATWAIRRALYMAIVDMQSIVKIPFNQMRIYKKVKKYIEQYEQVNGYRPSSYDIDIDENIEPRQIELLSNLPDKLHEMTIMSIDWDELPSSISTDDTMIKESQDYYVESILRKLNSREAYILRHVYGIGVNRESLSSIGEMMNLTRERIRQIAEKAIKKLRDIVFFNKTSNTNNTLRHEDTEGSINIFQKQNKQNPHQKEKSLSMREYYSSELKSSTLLSDLVKLKILKRKQLKYCRKHNLRTIGDVELFIEKYRLTPHSTRFTKPTLNMLFHIARLIKSDDLFCSHNETTSNYLAERNKSSFAEVEASEKEKDEESNKNKENIETVQIVNTFRTNPNIELRHNSYVIENENVPKVPIDINYLKKIFDNKSDSYKYFWFIAIISLMKDNQSLSIKYRDILIRMAALAWPVVLRYKIKLGKKDKIYDYLSEICEKSILNGETNMQRVESYLQKRYDDLGIEQILSPLLNNVPYSFLSPWVKFTSKKDVIKESNKVSFCGPYALYPYGIMINTWWRRYMNKHYRDICKFALNSFKEYVQLYNNKNQTKQLACINWELL